MTIALFVLTTTCLCGAFLLWAFDYIDGSLLLFFMGIVLGVLCGISVDRDEKDFKNKINLPEEHKAITWNKSKPDTLLGYHGGDTLYIKFK